MMMAEVPVSQKRRNDGFFHLKCQDVDGNRDAELQGKRMKGACRSASTPRERKDKVGERIAALQQLVSPFGKTDTASVLLEATGYIRFLHEQLEVLSAPYLKAPSPSPSKEISGVRNTHVSSNPHSLRSRGLCLVPVAYSQQLGSSNGADIWTPNTNSSK